MKLKVPVTIICFGALSLFGVIASVRAQQTSPIAEPSLTTPPAAQARRRIEINLRPPLYRRCIDWYELQHRPSGTVLYPQMRCWWVRG